MSNSEVRCPIVECPTGLQRTVSGTVADGVLAHLSVVHGYSEAVALTKFRKELELMGGVTRA